MKRTISLSLVLVLIFSMVITALSVSAAEIPFAPVGAENPYAADGATPFDYDGSEILDVPQIRVTTEDGNGTELEKADDYVNAHITIMDTDRSVLEDDCQFKVRGNSTAMTHIKKKPFTFKFAKKKDVLGMGKGKKWALLSNPYDPTLLRNYLTFELARELRIEYTSEQKFVELWVDGSYRGCYCLYEPVQEGKDRVNIDIESNDGKKDFLLEYESGRNEDDVTYLTVDGLRFAASDPDEPSEDQVAYMTEKLTEVFSVCKNGTPEEIAEVIDVDSFVRYYLLNEFVKNMDFGFSSAFYYYKDGKLYAGPPWDYDLSTGNLNPDIGSTSAANANKTDGLIQQNANIYRYFGKKDWFMEKVKDTYSEHAEYFASIGAQGGLLDQYYAANKGVIDRNYTVWRIYQMLNYQKPPFPTYQPNLDYLRNWLYERDQWMADSFGIYDYEYRVGDADGNSNVEINDVTIIQRLLLDMVKDDDGMIALRSSLSGNELSIADATIIQRYLAEMKTPYEVDYLKTVKLR